MRLFGVHGSGYEADPLGLHTRRWCCCCVWFSMAAVAKAVHRRILPGAIVSDDEATTMQEMAGQIMALRHRLDFERSRADKAEEELELLMIGDKKVPPKKIVTEHVKEEEEDKVAVQSLPGQDPVQAAYIHKLERKLANSGHLLAQEHRRVARREEEEDWAVMTDAWADKLVTAAGVDSLPVFSLLPPSSLLPPPCSLLSPPSSLLPPPTYLHTPHHSLMVICRLRSRVMCPSTTSQTCPVSGGTSRRP